MAKKSVEQLAEFYSGGVLNDTPWRGTTKDNGPEYLDLESLAQVKRGAIGESASPYRREIGIGESSQRVIRKSIPLDGAENY